MRMIRPTLALELQVARLTDTATDAATLDSAARLARFVERLADPQVSLALLCEYPVLARQVQAHVDAWLGAATELFARLCEDAADLATAGLLPRAAVLLSAELGHGDSHCGGRTVAVLVWDDGSKLLYKPRSLAVDAHFRELTAWVNQQRLVPELRCARLLDWGSHGWMEFVEARPCTTSEEVERFYARQGAMLALAHVLHGTDLHCENIIACGEYPMLIDLEALFHPNIPDAHGRSEPVSAVMAGSVLRIGLLPDPPANGAADGAGLGAAQGMWRASVPVWKGLGTDELRREQELVPMSATVHQPILEGRPVTALDHQHALCDAFDLTLELLARERETLLSPGGPVERFAHDRVRVILRSSALYALVLRETFHPDSCATPWTGSRPSIACGSAYASARALRAPFEPSAKTSGTATCLTSRRPLLSRPGGEHGRGDS